MKIVQIIPSFNLAGAEVMVEHLSYGLSKRKNELYVISLYDLHSRITTELELQGIKIFYLGKKRGFDVSLFFRIYNLLKIIKPDVVHTHLHALEYAAVCMQFLNIPKRIHTMHNIAQSETLKCLRPLWFTAFHHWHVIPVALTKNVQNSVQELYHIRQDNIPVVYNGIDLSKCIPKKDYQDNSTFTVLHIGRFEKQKNHKLLVEGFAAFHKKHPNSTLYMIGGGSLYNTIVSQVHVLGIDDVVHFEGIQDNVFPYLAMADVFVLPSIYEGMPMTIIEAMGTGLPIIASAVGGVTDILKDNINAMLLTDISVKNFSLALEKCYEDEKMRERIGRRAYQDSVMFGYEAMAQKYLELYSN